MVKRREPKARTLTAEQIEAFAAGAENGGQPETVKEPELNRNAKRDYKAIQVPFNQYEYEQLELGSQLSGRTKLNFIRYALLKFSEELQKEQG
ncbi:hypothetical protein [Crenothrix polyspora]|uniref:Uncharacterized protein n=1 Tax=Crenothrix polyspora TaxID=360316 RepID=A0A1R4HEJ8_9GAMM|nr:hypothetical protein [Crenothrix polyspora]SJM94639.1 conserved hypothetical protein [Crenothrix polyspora]